MTATEILTAARTAGIRLEARGERLHVEAPAGALTPTLRDQLTAEAGAAGAARAVSGVRDVEEWPNGPGGGDRAGD